LEFPLSILTTLFMPTSPKVKSKSARHNRADQRVRAHGSVNLERAEDDQLS
jgi:hypothetical protein